MNTIALLILILFALAGCVGTSRHHGYHFHHHHSSLVSDFVEAAATAAEGSMNPFPEATP